MSRRLLTIALAVCSAIGLAVTPSAVSANPTTPSDSDSGAVVQGCQSPTYAFQYVYHSSGGGDLATFSPDCSGTYNLNSEGFAYQARGWSGYIYLNDGFRGHFCDGNFGFIHGRVIRLVLSATTISECVWV